MPLLQSVIVLANKVSANLMVKNTLDGDFVVFDGQADHDPAHTIAIVVDYAGGCDRVLGKLIGEQSYCIQIFNILIKFGRYFLDA